MRQTNSNGAIIYWIHLLVCFCYVSVAILPLFWTMSMWDSVFKLVSLYSLVAKIDTQIIKKKSRGAFLFDFLRNIKQISNNAFPAKHQQCMFISENRINNSKMQQKLIVVLSKTQKSMRDFLVYCIKLIKNKC